MPMSYEEAFDSEARGIEIPNGEAFIVRGGRIPHQRLLVPADHEAQIKLVSVANWPSYPTDQLKPWVRIANRGPQGAVGYRRPVEARTRTIISITEMQELFADLQMEFPEDHREVAFKEETNYEAAAYAAAIVRARYFEDMVTETLPGGVFLAR